MLVEAAWPSAPISSSRAHAAGSRSGRPWRPRWPRPPCAAPASSQRPVSHAAARRPPTREQDQRHERGLPAGSPRCCAGHHALADQRPRRRPSAPRPAAAAPAPTPSSAAIAAAGAAAGHRRAEQEHRSPFSVTASRSLDRGGRRGRQVARRARPAAPAPCPWRRGSWRPPRPSRSRPVVAGEHGALEELGQRAACPRSARRTCCCRRGSPRCSGRASPPASRSSCPCSCTSRTGGDGAHHEGDAGHQQQQLGADRADPQVASRLRTPCWPPSARRPGSRSSAGPAIFLLITSSARGTSSSIRALLARGQPVHELARLLADRREVGRRCSPARPPRPARTRTRRRACPP